jgi:hypothetical protein
MYLFFDNYFRLKNEIYLKKEWNNKIFMNILSFDCPLSARFDDLC